MKVTAQNKLVKIGVLAAFGVFGLVACNDMSSDKGDNSKATDSSMMNNTAAADSVAKDSAAKATARVTRKKGKTSITMPQYGTDKMVMDKEGVYNRTDVMPEFPGGQDGLQTYVNSHLEYTQQAIDDNTTGTIKISFVVNEKGKIVNAHLSNGEKLGKGLEEEAVKVVNNMPDWKPGKVNGKNVKTRLELPITFQLEA